jgi:hypothetical protein
MEQLFSYEVVLPLIERTHIDEIMQLRHTSKSMKRLLNSREVLSILKKKYHQPNARSLDELYQNYNKVDELVWNIKDDNVSEVLRILSDRKSKTNKRERSQSPDDEDNYSIEDYYQDRTWDNLPSKFLPTVLSIAAMFNSVKVYTAVCPMIIPEIDEIIRVTQDAAEYIQNYLESFTYYTLNSSNADIYEAFFSSLSKCEAGLEQVFWEGGGVPDDVGKDMFLPYSHYLMTEDDSALKVMQGYFPDEELEDDLLEGYRYMQSLDFLHWLIESGTYTREQLKAVTPTYWNDYVMDYLEGKISYEEAKKEELRKQEQHLIRFVNDLKYMNELPSHTFQLTTDLSNVESIMSDYEEFMNVLDDITYDKSIVELALRHNNDVVTAIVKHFNLSHQEQLQLLDENIHNIGTKPLLFLCHNLNLSVQDLENMIVKNRERFQARSVNAYVSAGVSLVLVGPSLALHGDESVIQALVDNRYEFRELSKFMERMKSFYSSKKNIMTYLSGSSLTIPPKDIDWYTNDHNWVASIPSNIRDNPIIQKGVKVMQSDKEIQILRRLTKGGNGVEDLKEYLTLALRLQTPVTCYRNNGEIVVTMGDTVVRLSFNSMYTKYKCLDMFSSSGEPLTTKTAIKKRRQELLPR